MEVVGHRWLVAAVLLLLVHAAHADVAVAGTQTRPCHCEARVADWIDAQWLGLRGAHWLMVAAQR